MKSSQGLSTRFNPNCPATFIIVGSTSLGDQGLIAFTSWNLNTTIHPEHGSIAFCIAKHYCYTSMFKPEIPYTVQSVKAIIHRSDCRGGWCRNEVVDLRFFGVFDAYTKRLLQQAILELHAAGHYPADFWYEVANQSRMDWLIRTAREQVRMRWKRIRFPWRHAANMQMLGIDPQDFKKRSK